MDSSENDRFAEIGRIGKARGLQGETRFLPNDNFTAELFDRVSIFYLKNRRSDMVPHRLVDYRMETKKKQTLFFVKFDVIASRSDADQAMDRALYARRADLETVPDDSEFQQEPDLSGYSVYCDGTEKGIVLDVLENPAHPILQIKDKTGSLLIPYVDEYVQRIDHEKAVIHCKNLDQLT